MPVEIIDTNWENILQYGVCGYKDIKRPGYPEKLNWLKERFTEGLTIKTLYSIQDGTQGMIEYIPGEYCWRPVEAAGYMFIHCIFSGFKSSYKGKGYGSLLLKECIAEAKKGDYDGVAGVTRRGAFMAGKEIFARNGFAMIESAPPDFELLALRFNSKARLPRFKSNWEERLARYGQGLTIIRADQCPYTVKNVKEISELAERNYGIKSDIITLKNCTEAQDSPAPFGVFGILLRGKVIAHHPISGTRFANIMRQELKHAE